MGRKEPFIGDTGAAKASDAELVAAAKRGDRDSFAELVAKHQQMTLAVCWRLLGTSDWTADILQEAIAVALNNLERLTVPQRFGSWLCGIALNVARAWPRSQGLQFDPLPLDSISIPDGKRGPQEEIELAELIREVRKAVAQLSPGQRAAVVLYYIEGLPCPEVAARLNISVGAVKARLHLARGSLLRQLSHRPPMEAPSTEPRNHQKMRKGLGRRPHSHNLAHPYDDRKGAPR